MSVKKTPIQTEYETTTSKTPVEIIKQQQDIPLWDTLSNISIINNHGNILNTNIFTTIEKRQANLVNVTNQGLSLPPNG